MVAAMPMMIARIAIGTKRLSIVLAAEPLGWREFCLLFVCALQPTTRSDTAIAAPRRRARRVLFGELISPSSAAPAMASTEPPSAGALYLGRLRRQQLVGRL